MKLLVVDDHPMLRDGLAALLAQGKQGAVILQATDAPAGLDIAERESDLDAVMLDLSLPGMDGFAAIGEFRRQFPKVPVIVLSSSEDADSVRRALALGARGYIPKSSAPTTVLVALDLVMAGELYLPPAVLVADNEIGARARLTDRQADVLALLAHGHSNKAIAAELELSEKTVKAHIGAIFRALGVVNRTQAVNQARRAKLIP